MSLIALSVSLCQNFIYHASHFLTFCCRQIDRDCEFLEAERIMDYSLLVGIHFRDDNTGDKMGLSPFLLRTGSFAFHPGVFLLIYLFCST